MCVQWSVKPNPITIEVSVDGQSLGKSSTSENVIESYAPIRIGMHLYHPESLLEAEVAYFDDIVFDERPVPCR